MVGRILMKNSEIKAPIFSVTPWKVHIGSHLGIKLEAQPIQPCQVPDGEQGLEKPKGRPQTHHPGEAATPFPACTRQVP